VEIQKAGEIIPQVLRYLPEERPADTRPVALPEECPVCHGQVRRDPEGVYLRCLNLACPAQVKERLEHFAGRRAMDIAGLGPALIEQLVDHGLVRDPAGLFELDAETLAGPKRTRKKSAANLLRAVNAAKSRPLSRLLHGLGIRHVGSHIAEVLAGHFGSLDRLMDASVEELQGIHEIGETVAKSVRDFFDTEANHALLARLRKHGLAPHEEVRRPAEGPRPLEGQTVVVTGTLARYTRDGIEVRIKELGGHPTSSITGKTDFVLVGANPGSKLTKAQELGIRVVSEQEFDRLIGTSS
jgi:DNA ligase (NAD+)